MLTSLISLIGALQAAGKLNSAFDLSPTEALDTFERGYSDAQHMRDDNGVMNRFRRGIGDVRTSALKHETVSFLWVFPPRVTAYHSGFEARKKFESDDRIKELKKPLIDGQTNPAHHLWITAHIRLMPSRGGMFGKLSRRANPQDLEDVRVVLQVNGHVYQPIKQPGDLLAKSGTGINTFRTPETSTTTTNANVTTPRGNQYTVQAVSQSSYTITHEQNFKWYEGDFRVPFDLFDEDGTPRLGGDDKEFEVIVVYGSNERHAQYKLADFLKI